MLKMFKTYREENNDVEFKFIRIFKRIKKCNKWALVRVSLVKRKGTAFDPMAALPAIGKGLSEMGKRRRSLQEIRCR
jgi:hypothetical protein